MHVASPNVCVCIHVCVRVRVRGGDVLGARAPQLPHIDTMISSVTNEGRCPSISYYRLTPKARVIDLITLGHLCF